MPTATVAKHEEKFFLNTVPEGYVVIRRMTFGEKLERQDEMMRLHAGMGDQGFEVAMMNKKTALKDFGNLVTDHNLTDENERPLNFKNQAHVLALDPRVGDEISDLIDKINNYEEKPEIKN